jgi:hypothetical protein
MSTPDQTVDKNWKELATLDPEAMEARMVGILNEMNALSDEERLERRLAIARTENDLTDEELRAYTLCRLRAWLKLDPPVAEKTAALLDKVMKIIPGPQAMRQIALIQTMAREFSVEDQGKLVALAPNVFGGAPVGLSVEKVIVPPKVNEEPPVVKKKWWWPFG